MEDFHDLIRKLNPKRWKVFQAHHIKGINDQFFEEFGVLNLADFNDFLYRHRDLNPIGESSELIKESYCMITPDGRFYQDTNYSHNYSEPILEIGVLAAFRQINYDKKKYGDRGDDFFKRFPHS